LTFDKSATEKDIPLGRAHQSLLYIFCHYCDHQTHIDTPIRDDWTAITADDFNDYCTGPDYSAIQCTGAPLPPPLTNSASQPVRTMPSPIEIFKCGIKQDPALFTAIKDGKQFDSWQHSTIAQARVQDVADILDPSFAPLSYTSR